jgi:Flp pilus assembly protein TadB
VSALILAVGAALAAALAVPSRVRVPVVVASPTPEAREAGLRRIRGPLSVCVLLGGMVLLGPVVGAVVGAGAALWAWRVLGNAESPAERVRRARLESDLPLVVELLACCLSAGAPVVRAAETVAAALPGPVATELDRAVARLRLGADPVEVWSTGLDPALVPLGRTLARAHSTGGSVAAAVARLAEDLRGRDRSARERRARTVEVRAAAPLGICLLPAFLLLGVVPLTAGLFAGLDLMG